jgi:hypothetical protein
MLQVPRWKVDVTVGGKLVRTTYETAATASAAIAKAKPKLRFAVSSAGAFKFSAKRHGQPEPGPVTKKSPAQLDREITEALRRGGPIRHTRARVAHATRQSSADVWDVAMDAILEHDAARAAKIVKQIPGRRATETTEFSHALETAPDTVRAKFLELTEPKSLKPSTSAVAFFRKHGGYGVRARESKAKAKTRSAQALARAEALSTALGWSVEWEHDPYVDKWWDNDEDAPTEVLSAVLYDKDRNVLASLGGIGMSGNRKTDQDYGRVVEAELADEALSNLGLK